MSKISKRKYVTDEVLNDFYVPEAPQTIVKVLASRGNNLHLVCSPEGDEYLVSMPTKFRKHIWIKRGDFVVVEPIEEGDKVKAEIVTILLKHQIRHIKKEGKWPSSFQDASQEEEEGNQVDIFTNPNYSSNSDDSDSNFDSEMESDSSQDLVVSEDLNTKSVTSQH